MLQAVEVIRVGEDGVEPEAVDLSPKPVLFRGRHGDRFAPYLGDEGAILGANRDEALARDVPAEHKDVRLVRVRCGQELSEAAVGAVDVGREVDAEGPLFGTPEKHDLPP